MRSWRQWRGILLVALVSAAWAGATRRALAEDYDQVVDRYLAGDASARDEILQGGVESAVAIEDRLMAEQALDENAVRQLVEQLASDSFEDRQRASRSLKRSGDEIVPLLITLREETASPEARYRLSDVLDSLQSHASASGLPDLLVALYYEHAAELAAERMQSLASDPHDERGLLFVELAPHDQVWVTLRSGEERTKMLYLLARLYVLHDAANVETPLQQCLGEKLLELAAETYWPVELEPMARTLGSYHVARAERIEGARAYNVLSVDIEPHGTGDVVESDDESDDAPTRERRVLSCESFIMWIYLWRYEAPSEDTPTPVANKGEGIVLGVWGANHVRLVVATFIDPEMPLPVVRVSEREKNFWLTGAALEWARPLIPAEYVGQVRFRDRTRYEPAEILSMPDGAELPGTQSSETESSRPEEGAADSGEEPEPASAEAGVYPAPAAE